MMLGGFRVQCAFANMKSIAVLNGNSYKMGGKKEEKNRGLLVMMLGGSGSSMNFQIWKGWVVCMVDGCCHHWRVGGGCWWVGGLFLVGSSCRSYCVVVCGCWVVVCGHQVVVCGW